MPDSLTPILGALPNETSSGLVTISPPVLFFFLGMIAVAVRSNIAIPRAVTKVLSLYLLWAIGFKGGVELAAAGFTAETMRALGLGLGLAVAVPVWVYVLLRRVVTRWNAAAIAACFGSVSVVTFLTACAALDQAGTPYSGHMVAVMALMESPAIVVALLLVRWDAGRRDEAGVAGTAVAPGPGLGSVLHESLLNGPVLLLLGSIVVGMLTGHQGYEAFKPLCTDAFAGALAFFLLDLGLMAARRFREVVRSPKRVVVFALVAPVIHAIVAIAASRALGLSEGDAVLMAVLAASASYIAAPAALRMAIPRASPSLYIALTLGVTFPFNILIGIPLYAAVVRWWW